MWNVGSTLGKHFFVAAFLPALAFVSAADFFIVRRLLGKQQLEQLEYFGVKGIVYILASTAIGFLMLSLNAPIIKLFENGLFVSGWLKRRNQRRHDQRCTALLARRQAYREAVDRSQGLEEAIAKLEAAHEGVEEKFANRFPLPIDRDHVMPTALGNAFAVMEEYPYDRYGMDAMVYWPRLAAIIAEGYKAEIADLKTTLDFFLNCALLMIFFGLAALGLSAWPFNTRLFLYGLLAFGTAYGLYRVAVLTVQELGEVVKSCFDLYRQSLLEKLGLPKPASLLAERRLWLLLASFIRRGEDFYFPLPLAMGDDRALLQQELSRHTHNLHLLRQQQSVYAAGETPLYLLNQIEAEQHTIAEIEGKLTQAS